MLSTFLTQLQSYFSKYFVLGSFFPMLACVFLNGLIADIFIVAWRSWVNANILDANTGRSLFFSTSIVVAIVLLAYVLAGLGTFLRRMLEGQWSDRLQQWFVGGENRRREILIGRFEAEAMEVADLAYAPRWLDRIGGAIDTGRRTN